MRKVTVRVEPKARDKMLAYAMAVKTEIGGLLRVRLEGQTLIVSDAWTTPQKVTAGSVRFEPGHFEDDIKAQGYYTGKPMPWICMGIWHSHVDMDVFMSGTDEADLVRKFASRGYLVNIVVNRKNEWNCQVDTMVGPEGGKPEDFTLVTVPSEMLWCLNHIDVAAEIEANVKEREYTTVAGFSSHGHLGALSAGYVWDDEDLERWWNSEGGDEELYSRGKRERLFGGRKNRDKKRKRLPDKPPNDDKSIWTLNPSTGELIERDRISGRTLRMVKDDQTTFYDKDGKVLCVTGDGARTSVPRTIEVRKES